VVVVLVPDVVLAELKRSASTEAVDPDELETKELRSDAIVEEVVVAEPVLDVRTDVSKVVGVLLATKVFATGTLLADVLAWGVTTARI
jgi:hypothetical protein